MISAFGVDHGLIYKAYRNSIGGNETIQIDHGGGVVSNMKYKDQVKAGIGSTLRRSGRAISGNREGNVTSGDRRVSVDGRQFKSGDQFSDHKYFAGRSAKKGNELKAMAGNKYPSDKQRLKTRNLEARQRRDIRSTNVTNMIDPIYEKKKPTAVRRAAIQGAAQRSLRDKNMPFGRFQPPKQVSKAFWNKKKKNPNAIDPYIIETGDVPRKPNAGQKKAYSQHLDWEKQRAASKGAKGSAYGVPFQ